MARLQFRLNSQWHYLFVEDRFRLTSKTHLFAVIPPLSLDVSVSQSWYYESVVLV